jgi:methylated-DNA-[protein]-cysteine S-methyltransferase
MADRTLNYTKIASPIGKIHLLASQEGLAALYFDPQVEAMDRRFPRNLRGGPRRNPWLLRTEGFLYCYFAGDVDYAADIPLDLRGTPFQLSAWRELQRIAPGSTCTYGHVARAIRRPSASRAVGAAVGRNPVSLLIPCHRAIGSSGKLTGYAGGLDRKQFLLTHEREHAEAAVV